MKKSKGLSAWLVTWEWSGKHAEEPNKIADILSPRIPPKHVREIVELLYESGKASLSEKVAWRLRKITKPYPAEFTTLEGVKWEGEIICGHNPWLRARLVDNLIISTDATGKEAASWKDRHSQPEMREKIRKLKSH